MRLHGFERAYRRRLGAVWTVAVELSQRIAAAQRCAYAFELGRSPSPSDIIDLDLDRHALSALARI